MITIFTFALANQMVFASFPDVTDAYYLKAVNWLQANGIVQGYGDGTFKPAKSVTRAEFLKMLYETIGMKGTQIKLPFKDVKGDEWYIKYLKEAYANHVIDGYKDGTFKPDNTINVVEASKIVANAFFDVDALYKNGKNLYKCSGGDLLYDANAWYAKYLGVLDSLCLTPADGFMEGGFFPDLNMTRGGMAAMVYRAKASHDNGDVKYTDALIPRSKSEKNNSTESPKSTVISIDIKDFKFNPNKLTVKKGTKVTWTNNDSMTHTVTADKGTGPASTNLSTGGAYTYTFNEIGTFDYHCNIHPSMKGGVVVTE